jgi:hypothetical protein
VTAGLRRLYTPSGEKVDADDAGVPREVGVVAVKTVREEWRVEDRWWTPKPLQRHYFELALVDGRSAVVFRCELTGRWYRQRA